MSASFLKLKSNNNKLIIIHITPIIGKIDVVGSKLLKIYEFLINQFLRHNFKILKSAWEWDKKNDAALYFLFSKKPLQKLIEIDGPPRKMKKHVENFKKIHKRTFVKNNKLFAMEKRQFLVPEAFLKYCIRSQFVKERSKSISLRIT